MTDVKDKPADRTIFRVASRHKPYAQLGNAMLRDTSLSFEARGVLAFILTFPSNWQFGLAWLCRDQGIGRDRARRIINEHLASGYCLRSRARNADGTLGPYEYVFTDEPSCLTGEPQPEKAFVASMAGKPVTGEPRVAEPTATKEIQSHEQIHKKKEALQSAGTDARLPFTPAVLAEIAAIGVDATAIVERYRERTAGRHIADPSAYLLRMARDEAAKHLGVPVAALAGAGSRNRAERAIAQAASVGALAQPSDAVLRGVVRRARSRGDDPDALIAAWRASLVGRSIRTPWNADRSLLAFADHRALSQRVTPGNRERLASLDRPRSI